MTARRSITPADVARAPAPGLDAPSRFAFSPDDRWLAYLWSPEGTLTQRLFVRDMGSGVVRQAFSTPAADEQELSLEERLRKERARELGSGVTRFWWARRAPVLAVPTPSGVHLVDPSTGEDRLALAAGEGPVVDPRLSPDGSTVAFVRGGEVHLADLGSGEVRRLTEGADPASGITHGVAEYIAQEEMDRAHGMWWSPAGRWLAWTEVDESGVTPLRIAHLGTEPGGPPPEEVHRYPFPGEANAVVRLAVTPLAGGKPVWLDLGDEDGYLAWVHWLCDDVVVAAVERRDQRRLDLWRFEAATGERRHLWAEESEPWLNLHDLFEPLGQGGFVWASERSGFRHLWLHGADGRPERALTGGDWVVDSLVTVDEERGQVWFCANRDDARQRQLYRTDLDGAEPVRVTPEQGTHQVVIDHQRHRFVDTWSNLGQPPLVTLRHPEDGRVLEVLYEGVDPRVDELGLEPPRFFTVPAPDGTELFGACYQPEVTPAPTVVSVYGGPHVQRVVDDWAMTANLRAQYLRSLGFCVLVLDNRGSARRGVAFEAAIAKDMGNVEVSDQASAVEWAVAAGLTEAGRVGITGWSYGGYMSAMCLARAPETFRCAVAGAPVTAWDGYDTHYTERYLGTPQSNPDGYRSSAVMTHVRGIKGRLMLVHGLVDENVHFRHTARLVQALVSAGVDHDLLVFPEERHMPRREEDRAFLESKVAEFFVENLLGAGGPGVAGRSGGEEVQQ
ncbi:MAG TPA: DPP IV N-terminal domain-containing protein [Acidimicrobiales bacterium]|nr:DPP IV N-terminal domain-containing protein [Acidimicrobiales bacterium]